MICSALLHRVVLCIAISLTLTSPVLPMAFASTETLKPSARATQLLKKSEQNEQYIAQAEQNEHQADQALQKAKEALQLSRELQDSQAEAVAQEAMVTATAALAKARSNLVKYKNRQDSVMAALGRTGHSDVAMSISDIRGDVYIRTKAGLAKVGLNFKLQEGDALVTGKDGIAVISMADGSRVEAGANTEFKPEKLSHDEISLELLTGLIKSSVKKIAGRGRYAIHTAWAAIAVRGTEFSTEILDGVTTIRVQRGEVEVMANKNKAQVRLREGQRAFVHEDGTILGPLPDLDTRPSV